MSEAAPPRVALFLPSLEGGGAERAFINLAHGMAETGLGVDLVVAKAEGPYRAEVPPTVRLIDLAAPRLLWAMPDLVRYLRGARPLCIYPALEEANVLCLLAARLAHTGTRVVPSLRNTLSEEYARDRGLRSWVIERLARQLYSSVPMLAAVSEGVAADAVRFLSLQRERIQVVANPTITPDMAGLAQAPLDHPWFSAGAAPVVLACGRLAPQKDFASLIDAFARLRARSVDTRLLILGEGPLRSNLAEQAARLGVADAVAMPGFDPNPFRYMARASVFALSSLHEGSPNVLVQALACGCRIVSTDCPSGPREILAGLAQARLVPVADPAALAAALAALLASGEARPAPYEAPGFGCATAAAAYLSLAELPRPAALTGHLAVL